MLISLPIEIKVREFYNKLLLAYKVLDQTQHEILIGEKYKVYNIFKKNKNILLISKGGPEKNFFIKKKIANNKLMLLDEEGPVINFQNYVFENRISNKIFNIIDEYIFWGKKDYFYIKKKIKKTKIKVLGHPKFDTCKKPYIDIYKDEILKIKKKYKRFILFSSSFGTDTILKEKIYENFFFKNLQKDNKKNRNEISRDRDIEKKNYLDVINLIKVLAKLHPQINFIFRPHPRQNPEIIKKRFTSINNIKVIYKGTITPWIKACDLFMHSGCTSVLEAITMDKKIISFVSNKNEFRNNFYYKFGYHFNEEEILISNFLKILKKKNL